MNISPPPSFPSRTRSGGTHSNFQVDLDQEIDEEDALNLSSTGLKSGHISTCTTPSTPSTSTSQISQSDDDLDNSYDGYSVHSKSDTSMGEQGHLSSPGAGSHMLAEHPQLATRHSTPQGPAPSGCPQGSFSLLSGGNSSSPISTPDGVMSSSAGPRYVVPQGPPLKQHPGVGTPPNGLLTTSPPKGLFPHNTGQKVTQEVPTGEQKGEETPINMANYKVIIRGSGLFSADSLVIKGELTRALGKGYKTKPCRGGAIFIQCLDEDQFMAAKLLKQIDGRKVTASVPSEETYYKGVIKGVRYPPTYKLPPGPTNPRDKLNQFLEDLQDDLVEQGITKVSRVFTRWGKPTTMALLSSTNPLPTHVQYGVRETRKVLPYTPPPSRCTRCQEYNHTAKCTKQPKCVRCGGKHRDRRCQNTPHCANCGGPHMAYDTSKCPVYLKLIAVQSLKHANALTTNQAKIDLKVVAPPPGKQLHQDSDTDHRGAIITHPYKELIITPQVISYAHAAASLPPTIPPQQGPPKDLSSSTGEVLDDTWLQAPPAKHNKPKKVKKAKKDGKVRDGTPPPASLPSSAHPQPKGGDKQLSKGTNKQTSNGTTTQGETTPQGPHNDVIEDSLPPGGTLSSSPVITQAIEALTNLLTQVSTEDNEVTIKALHAVVELLTGKAPPPPPTPKSDKNVNKHAVTPQRQADSLEGETAAQVTLEATRKELTVTRSKSKQMKNLFKQSFVAVDKKVEGLERSVRDQEDFIAQVRAADNSKGRSAYLKHTGNATVKVPKNKTKSKKRS
jgi:hypothetical protein